MENLEKDLKALDFAQPPRWVKARCLVAAENALTKQARRDSYKSVAIALVAAGVMIAVAGTYIADFIAPVIGGRERRVTSPYHEPGANGMHLVPLPGEALGTWGPDTMDADRRDDRDRERRRENDPDMPLHDSATNG